MLYDIVVLQGPEAPCCFRTDCGQHSVQMLSDDLPIPVIQVNTILGGGDLTKIEQVLAEDDGIASNLRERSSSFCGKKNLSSERMSFAFCAEK